MWIIIIIIIIIIICFDLIKNEWNKILNRIEKCRSTNSNNNWRLLQLLLSLSHCFYWIKLLSYYIRKKNIILNNKWNKKKFIFFFILNKIFFIEKKKTFWETMDLIDKKPSTTILNEKIKLPTIKRSVRFLDYIEHAQHYMFGRYSSTNVYSKNFFTS